VTDSDPLKHARHRHHRPRLRRSQRRPRAHRPRREERGDPPQRQTLPGPAIRRTPASLPTNNQVAHRKRRPHQYPQAWLRLGSHPHRRHRRRPNLDRARRPDPQPGQDQCPRRVIDTAQATLMRQLDTTRHSRSAPVSFSGRSRKGFAIGPSRDYSDSLVFSRVTTGLVTNLVGREPAHYRRIVVIVDEKTMTHRRAETWSGRGCASGNWSLGAVAPGTYPTFASSIYSEDRQHQVSRF